MRTILFYWSVGLLSVSWLAGCGSMCPCHCDSCQPNRAAQIPSAPAPADAKPKQALLVPWRNQTPESPAPIRQLPVVEPSAQAPPAPKAEEPLVIRVKTFPEPDLVPDVLPPAKTEAERGAISKVVPPAKTSAASDASKDVFVEVPQPKVAEEAAGGKKKTTLSTNIHVQDGQAENFKSVTGQVQSYRKTLRLRYAAVDQDDIYGGMVILDGGEELGPLRDGQHVRVRGVLVEPERRGGAAHYRVQSVEILD